jgi:pyrophosphatase PpaX
MYNNILFDWDGCLADSLNLWLKTCKDVFKEFGYEVSSDQIVEKFFHESDGTFGFVIKDPKKFIDSYCRDVNSWMPKVSLNIGVIELLKELKKNEKKIAIVTSTSREAVMPAIRNLGLEGYIDVFLGREDVVLQKPNSEVIKKALLMLEAEKNESIIVGDSDNDIQAGKTAGIKTVLYYPDKNKNFYNLNEVQLEVPDYVISDFSQLLEIVNNE